MRSFLLLAVLSTSFLHAATYSVDCHQNEWSTLAKLRETRFAPGDRILLRSGCTWKGSLSVQGSGSPGAPIIIDRYGKGPLPRIDGGGEVEDTLLIKNQQWIEVRNLEITNQGPKLAVRRGVHVWLDNYGPASHITVSGLYIHDVNGINSRKDNGGIIFTTSGASKPSRFEGLTIERNIIWKVDRSAIAAQSAFVDRRKWFPSLQVIIRDNYVEDIGGDGIVPWASDGALVEHNIAKDCNKRAESYNAGIWPWSCDNTMLRWNEAMFTRTLKDGQGFDSDYNSRNTSFEYNYSHDNEGGFLLICTPKHAAPERMITNLGVEVRYNISRNDKTRTFHIPGPVESIRVHDNAIYVAAADTVNLVQFSDWGGYASDVEFKANQFLVEGVGRYGHEAKRFENGDFEIAPGFGPARNVRFTGNTYTGRQTDRPQDDQALTKPGRTVKNWNSPVFNPAQPGTFDKYLKQHRAWMLKLMRQQFGAAAVKP